MGVTVIGLVKVFLLMKKMFFVGAPSRDNGVFYVFTLQDETWTEDKILTAGDM